MPRALKSVERNEPLLLPTREVVSALEQDEIIQTDTIEVLQALNKRTFSNAHAYHINSLSISNDQESFVSADDLRINLWKLENSHVAFSKLQFVR